MDYKTSGVDIKAGDETVNRIKNYAKSTFNRNVLSNIGLFGAFYELDLKGYRNPVLVSSVDGVGTKLMISIQIEKFDTIGQDLVNHCVNDIAVCGAKPLFFLDYMAFGKLVPSNAESIISGFAKACKENDCALIGGETAEMPGLYAANDYDISGTIVGLVDKEKIINGSKIQKGDILIGFPSNGLHTNGYSLARSVLLNKYKIDHKFDELELTLGEELLKIHVSYLPTISKLIENIEIRGFSHITGGGIIGNTKRIIPDGLNIKIDWKTWEIPQIYKIIQREGSISDEEMRNVFNLGIGLIAIINEKELNKLKDLFDNLFYVVGEIN